MKKLKIAFNARTLAADTLRGWGRYTLNLLKELQGHNVHLYLFSDKEIPQKFLDVIDPDKYTLELEKSSKYFLWEQRVLPQLCKKYEVDILHCPINYGLPLFSSCPTVLTLHDAITEKYYGSIADPLYHWRKRYTLGSFLWKLSAKISHHSADKVITVSEHAKTDLVDFLKIPEKRVEVVYEAADPIFNSEVDEVYAKSVLKRHELNEKYFFYIGGWEGRKNLPFLVEAFEKSALKDTQLVIAGGKKEQKEELKQEFSRLGDQLKLLEWVEEEELPVLYNKARAFIYPSEYEGFGLQVCEAMSMKCPVFIANRTSLPEVAGEGGISFPLEDINVLVDLMKKVSTNEEFYKSQSEKAYQRSLEFSWKKAAKETMDVYLGLIDRD